ncbi:MFS glucose transporter mfs1 [Trichoderma ghanense]|uniref:MFS glucose transporter mfs1 n=1 Tax=Trichoderma ghanense TaxID=65468 RepID=A0ABY2HFL0_9HYPO
MSGKLDVMAFSDDWGHLKPFTRELMTAIMPTGSVMGALLSWTFVDMAQPRLVTAYATLFWNLGMLMHVLAPSIRLVGFGRLICGIAAGFISAVVPPYLAEIAGRSSRGRFARYALRIDALAGVSLKSGGMGYSASEPDPEIRTRFVNRLRCSYATQMLPGFVLLLLCDFLPPSPRQLATAGRWPEAKSLLADLHASGDGQNARVLAHVHELEGDVLNQPQVPHPCRELLSWRVRARLVLGMLVTAWSQLCGVQLVLCLSAPDDSSNIHRDQIMLPTAGTGLVSMDLLVVLLYLVNILFTLPAIRWLDSWGRRLVMKFGCLWMAACLFWMGLCQSRRIASNKEARDDNGRDETYVPWAIKSYHGAWSLGMIILCHLFIVAYAMSWGPITWVYPAEIFPVNWMACIYLSCVAHETKGYTLEEMHHVFLSGRRAWQPASGENMFDLLVARMERQQSLHGTSRVVGGPGHDIELSEWVSHQAGHPDASPT